MRLHIVLDDAGSFNIGQCAFKRSGYFDAHTPVVFGYHHQDAVADVAAANFPCVCNAVGIGGNVFSLGAANHQDDNLAAFIALECCQFGL